MLKHCRCCKATYDADAWARLPYVGIQPPMVPGDPALELRNCPAIKADGDVCGSTLALPLKAHSEAA